MFPVNFGCFITSAVNRKDQPPPAPAVSELAEVNALPGAEIQAPAGNGYVEAGPENG